MRTLVYVQLQDQDEILAEYDLPPGAPVPQVGDALYVEHEGGLNSNAERMVYVHYRIYNYAMLGDDDGRRNPTARIILVCADEPYVPAWGESSVSEDDG